MKTSVRQVGDFGCGILRNVVNDKSNLGPCGVWKLKWQKPLGAKMKPSTGLAV